MCKVLHCKMDKDTAIFFPHIDQMINVKPLLSLHPHHGNMKDAKVYKNLSPHTPPLSHFVNYSHVNLVTEETPERVSCNTREDHIEKMVLDHIVFKFHVIGEVMICLSSRILNLFIEVASIDSHEQSDLTKTQRSKNLVNIPTTKSTELCTRPICTHCKLI